jgi:hypothetical protein
LFAEENKKVGFVICSNEPINYDLFHEMTIFRSNNHVLEDLYTLAACDYLIGVPSTYLYWASFYGEKPVYVMKNNNKTISRKDDFVLYKRYPVPFEDL